MSRKAYPTDVSDEEWEFVVSYLTLLREDAGQRVPALRDVFDAVCWISQGRLSLALAAQRPAALDQQYNGRPNAGARPAALRRRRTTCAGCCGCSTSATCAPRRRSWMGVPCKAVQRVAPEPVTMATSGKKGQQGACRRRHARPPLGRAGHPGHLLAVLVTPANDQARAQVGELARQVQEATQRSVQLAYVDQGHTGEKPAAAADEHGIELEVIELAEAKRGFVLLPRRWVVERSSAWLARFRRLSRHYERLPTTLAAGCTGSRLRALLLSNLFRTLTSSA